MGLPVACVDRTEAHAGDTVSALNGHAVGGEGPFVGERAALTQVHGVPFGVGVGVADARFPPQGVVGVRKSLDVGRALLIDPGGEVALGLVDLAGPGRAVVHVHGYRYILAVLLHAGQVPDLLQAGVPGLVSSTRSWPLRMKKF